MLKISRLFLPLVFSFCAVQAQETNNVNNPPSEYPPLGTCNIDPQAKTNNLSPQNGNGSLGQIYNLSKCGLNYTQATRRLGRRGSLNGAPQPATFTITGLPACYVIERAYIWSSMSGTQTAFNVTIVNPAAQSFTVPAQTIGTGPDKCWGYGGTSSYRVDVTAAISGNGNYTISGFPTNPPTPQKDTDGATLFIIYSDPSANYQGHMVIHDGCLVGIGGNTAQTMTGINACATSIYARAFCMTGDWQLNGISGNWNGSPINIPWNWWNYNEVATTVNNAQATALYTHAGLNDCYNWVVMGLYYRTNTCITCPAAVTINLNTTTTPATCANCNGTATVTATGGNPPYTYTWAPSGGNAATATGLCAGTYTVTVSDGCFTSTAAVTITTAGGALNVTSSTTNVSCANQCNGSATLTVSNGQPPYTYAWAPSGGNAATATGLCAGTYTATVTDAAGCTTTHTVTITQPPPLTIQAAGFSALCNAACNGQAVTIPGGGTGPYTYNWAPSGGTNASATGLCAGTYTVTVTDANGCTITDTAIVSQPPPMTATTTSVTANCNQADGQACVNMSGGSPPYSYLWTPSAQTGNCANNLTPGQYCVTVTDANGCTFSTCVTVPNAPGVTATMGASSDATCFNACDGSATVNASGGVGPYTYAWAPSGGNAATANGLCAGTYTVTVTDASGCTSTATVTINQPQQLAVTSTNPAPICIGQCATLVANVTGGTPAYNITWAPAGPNVCPTVTTTYTVTVTDANGCTATPATVTVTVNPPLAVSASANPTAICVGASSQLSATGSGGSGTGYTYTWTPGNLNGQNVNVSPTATTTYTVTLSDNCNSPTVTATVTITVNPAPVVAFVVDNNAGCAPLCVNFTDQTNGASQWNWSFQGGAPATSTSQNPGPICFNLPGSYNVSLSVVDNNGCSSTTVINQMITVHPNPQAGFTPSADSISILNPTICFTSTASGASTYFWDFGDPGDQFNNSTQTNPCHTYSDTGLYCIKQVVATQYGCTDSVTYCVWVMPDFTFYAPNAFTPNGDGINDLFFPLGEGIDPNKFEMWIFDRWGNNIFYTQRWGEGWDGKANGGAKIAQEDVYVWKCVVYDFLGKKHSYIGHVSLIK